MAGLRFLLSAIIVACLLAIRGRRIKLTRDDTICILTLGLLVFWLDYGLIYWAETRVSSGLTAVLFSTMPLMTALLSAFWMRSEMLTVRKVTGILDRHGGHRPALLASRVHRCDAGARDAGSADRLSMRGD